MDSSYKLNDPWILWIHYTNDTNWGLNSYKSITKFSDLVNGIKIIENINQDIINKCNCFIMKEKSLPIWEHETNIKGGNLSYKIYSKNIVEIWKHLCYRIIGNTITNDEEILNMINGISIAFKRNFYIIKIWLGDISNITDKNSIFYDFIINKNKNKIDDPLNIAELLNLEKLICIFKQYDT